MESCKYIVKTKKIRGVLSQGLIMPLSMFPEITCVDEDTDLTELLGIDHREYSQETTGNNINGNGLPGFIKKTECERIQNIKNDKYTDKIYYITEKLDGSSATFGYTLNDKFLIGSRRMDITNDYVYMHPNNTHWYKAADNHNLLNKLVDYPGLMFQGEIVGPGIQQNKYKLKDVNFYVFRIHDLNKNVFLSMNDMIDMCGKLELLYAPILVSEPVKIDSKSKDQWLEYADGQSLLNKVCREGIVLSPIDKTDVDYYYSIKVISNLFLLKQK